MDSSDSDGRLVVTLDGEKLGFVIELNRSPVTTPDARAARVFIELP